MEATAAVWCPRCAAEHPADRAKPFKLGMESVLLCPACGMVTRPVRSTVERPMGEVLVEALGYLKQPHAAVALVALSAGQWLFGHVPLVGGLISLSLVWGYVFAVVQRSMAGKSDLPPAVDFEHWVDLFPPLWRGLFAAIPGVAPLVIALVNASSMGPALTALSVAAAVAWAAFWTPGAIANAALCDGALQAANPVTVVAVATRLGRDYLAVAGVVAGLSLAAAAVTAALRLALSVPLALPIVGSVVSIVLGAVSLAFGVTIGRVVGLAFYERRHALGLDA